MYIVEFIDWEFMCGNWELCLINFKVVLYFFKVSYFEIFDVEILIDDINDYVLSFVLDSINVNVFEFILVGIIIILVIVIDCDFM